MARTKKATPQPEDSGQVIDIAIDDEMRASYLEYAYSVIYTRALPDARDGLKPVQRRLLYTMSEMGLRPERAYVKCSRVVGETMGKYHPHGDTALYDALARMAQDWVMRQPLVDGHGNFGSADDAPAAMRYTECRMDAAAVAMTASLDEDVVDFRPNYDGSETQPAVLPAALPNLLVNGSTGIAVGMATNMAPHNLVEVVAALRHLLAHPEAGLDEIMRFVPGPDLPTGGKIVGLDGIRDAYDTGRGSFRIRGATRIESITPRRQGIVVTELPYTVGSERLRKSIRDLVEAKKLTGIASLEDHSDMENGMRIVIGVKNGINPEALLAQLFKLTPLEDSFSINNVALVEGQPRTLGLVELLRIYLDHRLEVTRRRTAYRHRKASDELHLVEGLLIAVLDIDEVIELIRSSEDADTARSRLMSVFDLSQVQADHILALRLRRLTKFSRLELEKQRDELVATIEELAAILAEDDRLNALVSAELAEMAQTFGTPRRTVLLESAGTAVTAAAGAPLEIPDDPCTVLLSSTGLLARIAAHDGDATGGRRARRVKHDAIVSAAAATNRGEVGLLTSLGRVHRLSVMELPALPATAGDPSLQGGAPLREFVSLASGEKALCLLRLGDSIGDSAGLALGTAGGVVKRVTTDYPKGEVFDVIALKDGDTVVGATELTDGRAELVFVTSDASLLHFPATAVRPQGRGAGGMAGIRLAAGAQVVFFGAVTPTEGDDAPVVVTVSGSGDALPGTDAGSVKVTHFAAYPAKGRGTGGVRAHRFLRGEDTLLLAFAGAGPARAAAGSGAPVELPEPDDRRDGSGQTAPMPIEAVAPAWSPAAGAT